MGFQGTTCHRIPHWASFWQRKSQHRVHSGGSRLGGERGAPQTLLPYLIFHAVEKNHYFYPKQRNRVDLCCVKRLLEPRSCLLTFRHPAEDVWRAFSERASPVFRISFELGATRARSSGEVEVPAQPHQPQPRRSRQRPPQPRRVTPQDLGARCQRCSADGKSSSRHTKEARIQL